MTFHSVGQEGRRVDGVLQLTLGHAGKYDQMCCFVMYHKQGRREKLRAPGQKFRLGPLVGGAPKSRDKQKKVIASADVRISARNKKKHHRVRRP